MVIAPLFPLVPPRLSLHRRDPMRQALNYAKHVSQDWLIFLSIFSVVVSATGCDQGADNAEVEIPVQKVADPEEQFDRFITELKKLVESRSSYSSIVPSMGSESGSATTSLSWSARVGHQLIPPKEGKPYRAMVTVFRNTEVTVVVPPKSKEQVEREKAEEARDFKLAKEHMPELVNATGIADNPASKIAKPSIESIPDKDVTNYELEFQKDRWVLLTPIDKIKYPFTSSAFDTALRLQ